LELIELYSEVNGKVISENPNQDRLFIQSKQTLDTIRELLDELEIELEFGHVWFMGTFDISFWYFFNKFNKETEKKEEIQNVKKFFVKYKAPKIP